MRREVRLLVFGGAGQLGQALALCDRPGRLAVRTLDRDAADITDAARVAEVIAAWRPDVAVNAAAYTQVDHAEADEAACLRVNRDGAGIVAQECAAAGVPIIHISTDHVFDGARDTPYREDDAIAPVNMYGLSKAEGEVLVRSLAPRHVILRTAWLFGPHGRNFCRTVQHLAEGGLPLRIVADQHGCPTPAAALAQAIGTVARRIGDGQGAWGTFHFAGQPATTWHGFASAIVAMGLPAARRPRVLPITTRDYPTRARRPAFAVLDCLRIRAAHGIAAPDWRHALPWHDDVPGALLQPVASMASINAS
jgi:dTDP-4-dehydrorhamnose reductase